MIYALLHTPSFERDVVEWASYLRRVDATASKKYFNLLDEALLDSIAASPSRYSYFHETGAPYRARLFRMAGTAYWIIYKVNEETQSVELPRFWNSARKPPSHGLGL
jgi:plasmid stabilization system protein ParE